jgi:hypothetical protein
MQNDIQKEMPSSIIGQGLSCLLDESQSTPVENLRLRHPFFKFFFCMPIEHFYFMITIYSILKVILLNALSNLTQPIQLLKHKLKQDTEMILYFLPARPK